MTLLRYFLIGLWLLAAPLCAQTLQDTRDAAAAGDADAQYAMGLRYFSGDGVAENFAESARWLALAAEQGHARASNHLGRYYHSGLGVEPDRARAIELLEIAAQDGTPDHLFDLGKALEPDIATLPRAAAMYAQAANSGHIDAMVSLGVLYQDGRGVAQDFAKAKALYEPAARDGHPRAQSNLGLMYVRGSGVAQDYERAAEYFAAAANAGLATAYTNLGVLYENGFGVPLDEVRAAELYRAAAAQSPQAQSETQTAMGYDTRLKPVDTSDDGLSLIAQQAEAGDPVAAFQMGWVLMQNPDAEFAAKHKAAELFRIGAQAGHGPSMRNLGVMYFDGAGLPQDFVLGHMWLLLAKSAGTGATDQISAALTGKMTAGQINESQARVQAYLKGD